MGLSQVWLLEKELVHLCAASRFRTCCIRAEANQQFQALVWFIWVSSMFCPENRSLVRRGKQPNNQRISSKVGPIFISYIGCCDGVANEFYDNPIACSMGPAQLCAWCFVIQVTLFPCKHVWCWVAFQCVPGVKKYICTCFWVVKAISASSKGQLQGVLTKLILANFINFELGFGEADQRK